jgi:hypothetical protein
MADSFAARFAAVRSGPGPLVWGLDPAGRVLDEWGLGDTPDGLERFADIATLAHRTPRVDSRRARSPKVERRLKKPCLQTSAR